MVMVGSPLILESLTAVLEATGVVRQNIVRVKFLAKIKLQCGLGVSYRRAIKLKCSTTCSFGNFVVFSTRKKLTSTVFS